MRNDRSNEPLGSTLDRSQLSDNKGILICSINDALLRDQVVDGGVGGSDELVGQIEETE